MDQTDEKQQINSLFQLLPCRSNAAFESVMPAHLSATKFADTEAETAGWEIFSIVEKANKKHGFLTSYNVHTLFELVDRSPPLFLPAIEGLGMIAETLQCSPMCLDAPNSYYEAFTRSHSEGRRPLSVQGFCPGAHEPGFAMERRTTGNVRRRRHSDPGFHSQTFENTGIDSACPLDHRPRQGAKNSVRPGVRCRAVQPPRNSEVQPAAIEFMHRLASDKNNRSWIKQSLTAIGENRDQVGYDLAQFRADALKQLRHPHEVVLDTVQALFSREDLLRLGLSRPGEANYAQRSSL